MDSGLVLRTPGNDGLPCPRLHVLFDPGALFRRDRAPKTVALLQALPVGRDVGPEIFCQPDIVGQPQGIADYNVGGGEPAGAERFRECLFDAVDRSQVDG